MSTEVKCVIVGMCIESTSSHNYRRWWCRQVRFDYSVYARQIR